MPGASIQTAADVVRALLNGRPTTPVSASATGSAPVNIALVKYWGKRDLSLNLPVTSSLSISLAGLDTVTEIAAGAFPDSLTLDTVAVAEDAPARRRLSAYLDLFRTDGIGFRVVSRNAVPTAAGLASSASGFAALVRSLDALFGWRLSARELSILARLGSGSACRSLFPGFVEWRAGTATDGMDSFGVPLPDDWPDLRIGLWVLNAGPKPMSSREAMRHTMQTSPLYRAWPETVAADLGTLRTALVNRDADGLFRVAESNALAMHATMAAARPPVLYSTPDTHTAIERIHQAQTEGLRLGFTMDAGPNIKLLFLESDRPSVLQRFPDLRIVAAGRPVSATGENPR